MILILCDEWDRTATWVAAGLRERCPARVEVVTAAELLRLPRIVHRVSDSVTEVAVRLPGWRGFDDSIVTAIVSRLVSIPDRLPLDVTRADRSYAMQEIWATTLSWLYALRATGIPFVGKPHPAGLCGPWRAWAEWCLLASAAGIPVRKYSETLATVPAEPAAAPRPPVAAWSVVLADRAYGNADPLWNDGAIRLAQLADADSLGVGFDATGHLAATAPVPELRLGGAELLDQLTALLTAPATRSRR